MTDTNTQKALKPRKNWSDNERSQLAYETGYYHALEAVRKAPHVADRPLTTNPVDDSETGFGDHQPQKAQGSGAREALVETLLAHNLFGPWRQDGQPDAYAYAGSCGCGENFFAEDAQGARRLWAAHVAALSDGRAIRSAAHKALGEWLAWPDAARDGPVAVDDEKVLSWLSGLPNKLAAISQPPEASEVEAVAYLKFWWDGQSPRTRVDLSEICEPWLDALKPTITPLYAHPPKASPMQAMTLVQARRIVDAVTEHCRGADFSCDMKAATKSVLALAQPAPEQGEVKPE